jgi:hypothetical protein
MYKDRAETKEQKQIGGLCATCEQVAGCMFLRTAKSDVVSCEEFTVSAMALPSQSGILPVKSSAQEQENAHELGLCANCANRSGCSLRSADVGVWHCEEYI